MKKNELNELINNGLGLDRSTIPPRTDIKTGKKFSDPDAAAGAKDLYMMGGLGMYEGEKDEGIPDNKVNIRDIEKIIEDVISKRAAKEDVLIPKRSYSSNDIRLDRQTTVHELKEISTKYRMELLIKLLKYLGVDKLSNFEKKGLINYINGKASGKNFL